MNAEYKAGDSAANLASARPSALGAWLSMEAFIDVAKTQTDVTAASILHGFQTVKNLNLGAMSTMDAERPGAHSRLSPRIKPLRVFQ